jgi:hypothetical protein
MCLCRAGAYHLLAQDGIVAALKAPYSSAQYPTAAMRDLGMVCGCSFPWLDPCRIEFRKASRGAVGRAATTSLRQQ